MLDQLELGIVSEINQREDQFNIAPTQKAAKTINARAETVATKPAFRGAFKKRRCLVPDSDSWRTGHAMGWTFTKIAKGPEPTVHRNLHDQS